MTWDKRFDHANWNWFNTCWRSLCLQWQLRDASCMKKPIAHDAQVGSFIHSSGNIFIRRSSRYMASIIFPSIIWILPLQWEDKHSHTRTLPPPDFTAGMMFFGVICGAICPPNKACGIIAKKWNFCLCWPDYILPVVRRFFQMLCRKLQTSFNVPFLR